MSKSVINITFHGLGIPGSGIDPAERPYWLATDRFSAILDVAKGDPRVRVTFDDGNASDMDVALPALKQRSLSGAFFLVAARLGRPDYVSASQARILVSEGMIVGSHGMKHRPWRGLPDSDAIEELQSSRKALEDVLGSPVTWAACPFGSYDRVALARLRDAGYERVYTSDRGPAEESAWLQPRTTIESNATADSFRQWLASQPSTDGPVRKLKLAVKRWR